MWFRIWWATPRREIARPYLSTSWGISSSPCSPMPTSKPSSKYNVSFLHHYTTDGGATCFRLHRWNRFFFSSSISQPSDIPDVILQVKILNLLILALPDVHRDVLECILTFLEKIISYEHINSMNLHNVAMIVAPNLFLPKAKKGLSHGSDDRMNIEGEVQFARLTCQVTKLLIKYFRILWTVSLPRPRMSGFFFIPAMILVPIPGSRVSAQASQVAEWGHQG